MTHQLKSLSRYTLLTFLTLFMVVSLTACGDEATVTSKPVPTSTATSIAVTTTQAARITSTQTTPPTSWKAQDLVGQIVEKKGIKVTVTRAEVLASVPDTFSKSELKPSNGVFLVLFFNIENTTGNTYTFNRCMVFDAQKKEFPDFEFNATASLFKVFPDFAANATVPANSKSQSFRMWDVPADAKGPLVFDFPTLG